MGKDTMFFWPLAGLFKRIGGLPINRRERTGFVGAMVEEFRRRDFLWIAVAPEGTRSHTDHLKSGFYRVAREADVPLGLAYIDYGRRRIALEDYVRMTGDEARDLATLRDFYADKRGRHPAKAGDIRFRTPTPDVIEP
jgi:1-acyl-sn-glycerol-3-phosphate acyltransferase